MNSPWTRRQGQRGPVARMPTRSRTLSLTLTLALATMVGCATTPSGGGGNPPPAAPFVVDPPARAGVPTLLVAMPGSADFIEVRASLVSELRKNFNVSTLLVGTDTKATDLAEAVKRSKPACAVLMNNVTLNLYRQYEATQPAAGGPSLPVVVVMAAFIEEAKAKLKRATGIAYEVPGVTAFMNLRMIVKTPVNRVGVVYRPAFHRFIERQRALAAREHVEIVAVPVNGDVTVDSLRAALRQVTEGAAKVDAVWMLNDNGLLRDGEFLEQTWKPELGAARLPLIVGVSNLVDPASPLGTLAIVPDLEALGLQTANLIFDLSEDDWRVEDHPVELPLSVKAIVDVKSVRANFGLQPFALQHVDQARE